MTIQPKERGMIRSAQDIYRVVDEGCTLVVNEERREVFRLSGLEQAVWDCLEMGYSAEKLLQTVAALGKLTPEAAEREVRAILLEWQSLGMVEFEAEQHG